MHHLDEISLYAVPPSSGPMDGYSYCGLKFVESLNKMKIKTPWRDDDSPVSISFCQPDWYSQSENQYKVFYTPWESTRIPDGWVPWMNKGDWLWTTSQWCKDVFLEAGVKGDIEVVPHGIDLEEWTISKRKPRKVFNFFHMGEPAVRKNGQLVYDAFMEVFGGNQEVNLVMKSNGFTTVRHPKPFGPITDNSQITLITEKLTIFELNQLYQNVHCMIYPSAGEGFGMIPFQAIATGMPTLLTDFGGVKEFSEYAVPGGLDYTVGPSHNDYHLGNWAHTKFDDLCEKMVQVYKNYEDYSQTAYERGLDLRERFAWDDVVSDAIDKLRLRIKF